MKLCFSFIVGKQSGSLLAEVAVMDLTGLYFVISLLYEAQCLKFRFLCLGQIYIYMYVCVCVCVCVALVDTFEFYCHIKHLFSQ